MTRRASGEKEERYGETRRLLNARVRRVRGRGNGRGRLLQNIWLTGTNALGNFWWGKKHPPHPPPIWTQRKGEIQSRGAVRTIWERRGREYD